MQGAFFHVITRGNQKQKIFKDPFDYRKFFEILVGYKQRYHFHLYAYILMSNHVHLLIETGDIPLSNGRMGSDLKIELLTPVGIFAILCHG